MNADGSASLAGTRSGAGACAAQRPQNVACKSDCVSVATSFGRGPDGEPVADVVATALPGNLTGGVGNTWPGRAACQAWVLALTHGSVPNPSASQSVSAGRLLQLVDTALDAVFVDATRAAQPPTLQARDGAALHEPAACVLPKPSRGHAPSNRLARDRQGTRPQQGALRFSDVAKDKGLTKPQWPAGPDTSPNCRWDQWDEGAGVWDQGGFCNLDLWPGGVAVGDVDGDGRPDVYLCRKGARDLLLLSRCRGERGASQAGSNATAAAADCVFVDVTEASGIDPGPRHHDSAGAVVLDADGDGFVDIYVTTTGEASGFKLYMNDGQGAFREEAAIRGAANLKTHAVADPDVLSVGLEAASASDVAMKRLLRGLSKGVRLEQEAANGAAPLRTGSLSRDASNDFELWRALDAEFRHAFGPLVAWAWALPVRTATATMPQRPVSVSPDSGLGSALAALNPDGRELPVLPELLAGLRLHLDGFERVEAAAKRRRPSPPPERQLLVALRAAASAADASLEAMPRASPASLVAAAVLRAARFRAALMCMESGVRVSFHESRAGTSGWSTAQLRSARESAADRLADAARHFELLHPAARSAVKKFVRRFAPNRTGGPRGPLSPVSSSGREAAASSDSAAEQPPGELASPPSRDELRLRHRLVDLTARVGHSDILQASLQQQLKRIDAALQDKTAILSTGLSVYVTDVNLDGFPDLYTTDWHPSLALGAAEEAEASARTSMEFGHSSRIRAERSSGRGSDSEFHDASNASSAREGPPLGHESVIDAATSRRVGAVPSWAAIPGSTGFPQSSSHCRLLLNEGFAGRPGHFVDATAWAGIRLRPPTMGQHSVEVPGAGNEVHPELLRALAQAGVVAQPPEVGHGETPPRDEGVGSQPSNAPSLGVESRGSGAEAGAGNGAAMAGARQLVAATALRMLRGASTASSAEAVGPADLSSGVAEFELLQALQRSFVAGRHDDSQAAEAGTHGTLVNRQAGVAGARADNRVMGAAAAHPASPATQDSRAAGQPAGAGQPSGPDEGAPSVDSQRGGGGLIEEDEEDEEDEDEDEDEDEEESEWVEALGNTFKAEAEDSADGAGLRDGRPITMSAMASAFPLVGAFELAATWADLDGDGWPDGVLSGDFGTTQIYWNNGDGSFTRGFLDLVEDMEDNSMGCTVGDVNGDGLPDITFSSVFVDRRRIGGLSRNYEMAGFLLRFRGNHLYINLGNRRFVDVTDSAGVREAGWAWGATLLDADNDGTAELFVANGLDDPETTDDEFATNEPNRFFVPQGFSRPVAVGAESGEERVASAMAESIAMVAAAAEAMRNGPAGQLTDARSMAGASRHPGDLNGSQGGSAGAEPACGQGHSDLSARCEASSSAARGSPGGGGARDGWPRDSGVSPVIGATAPGLPAAHRSALFPDGRTRAVSPVRFREVGAAVGLDSRLDARGVAVIDYNGDGALDLLVVNHQGAPSLMENQAAGLGGFLRVVPRQPVVEAWLQADAGPAARVAAQSTVDASHFAGRSADGTSLEARGCVAALPALPAVWLCAGAGSVPDPSARLRLQPSDSDPSWVLTGLAASAAAFLGQNEEPVHFGLGAAVSRGDKLFRLDVDFPSLNHSVVLYGTTAGQTLQVMPPASVALRVAADRLSAAAVASRRGETLLERLWSAAGRPAFGVTHSGAWGEDASGRRDADSAAGAEAGGGAGTQLCR
ncbi:hypothetical protein FNF27_07466 [Cafeteria roenbergensis]|uniref:ASPIC/UnbV domain-containing protein n=1 Tax=Cafeteria roenbergensis TaxID=33653 RepID=A0A5A8DQ31_CAFRO|nr:hypothetical protein FNF27_07466 [Cafeteria roenbergensis]